MTIVIVAAYAVVGSLVLAFGGRLGRRAFVVGCLPCALTLAWLIPRIDEIIAGRVSSDRLTWVAPLDLSIDLRLDGLAATMSLIVAGGRRRSCSSTQPATSRPTRPTSAGSPGCWCCSPARCSASSRPTTCSCSTRSGS